jgi:Fe-S-cluster-containing dehydrogenase component/CRP-like cAMP-binding protein
MRTMPIDGILAMAPFNLVDESRFPAKASLRDIIRNDSRVLRFHPGDIIVREGDYVGSTFFILGGTVREVVSPALPAATLGRREPQRKTIFSALKQLWQNHKDREVREPTAVAFGAQAAWAGTSRRPRQVIEDIQSILQSHETNLLAPGDIFGETSALARAPMPTTVFADADVHILEIRWQGLRAIRNRSESFKDFMDRRCKEHSLRAYLRELPLFYHLDEVALTQVVDETLVETYGDFDWHAPYKAVIEKERDNPIEHEAMIAQEGHYADGLILIRAGFARVSEEVNHGHRTLNYLRQGDLYGLEEIVHNWRCGEQIPFRYSLRAVSYVSILRIPTATVETHILPAIPADSLPSPVSQVKNRHILNTDNHASQREIEVGMLEFLVRNRFINGTSAMLIDLDRCTRCDDCVRACAAAHDNNPRFIRHGKQYNNYMVANACMHCVDPVCMIGCPTGAIHRHETGGQVVINEQTCIGCETCAKSCPYHDIRMVQICDPGREPILDERGVPVMKATKCDLCIDQPGGPACERACAHDALVRIDLCDSQSLAAWLNR